MDIESGGAVRVALAECKRSGSEGTVDGGECVCEAGVAVRWGVEAVEVAMKRQRWIIAA